MTRTVSPGLKRGSATPLDLRHLARQLLGRNDAALDERLGQRDDPALVVAHLVVGLGRQRLDVPAPLVHGDALGAHQHGEGVHAPFPFSVVVLGRLDLAGRQPAHVVMPSFDHATHSETGACASCKASQTISTSVGCAEDSAFFSPPFRSDGGVTLQLSTPEAATTMASLSRALPNSATTRSGLIGVSVDSASARNFLNFSPFFFSTNRFDEPWKACNASLRADKQRRASPMSGTSTR